MNKSKDTNYIIEFIAIGKSVRVSAFDPETLTEATIVAPSNLSKDEMIKNAVNKLEYLLKKKGFKP